MSELMNKNFSYSEFITRNFGFTDEGEQKTLKEATVFIPGVGGMGGIALETLVRAGVENFVIADQDVFEVSNLNRQVMATMNTVGVEKTEATVERMRSINPNVKVKVYDHSWFYDLDAILSEVDVVINGCDDVKATVKLMREAKKSKKTVIDAFASTLPSVYVVKPSDPRPEEFFQSPTRDLDFDDMSDDTIGEAAFAETVYVITNSSTINHVHLNYAAEMISGERSRISFAPMVWSTGILMAYEAIKILLGKKTNVTYKGVFMNPWTSEFEKPLNPVLAWIKRYFVKRELLKLKNGVKK